MANLYHYKQINSGQHTIYYIFLAESCRVAIDHHVRGKSRGMKVFESRQEVKASKLPKKIQQAAEWAFYSMKVTGLES